MKGLPDESPIQDNQHRYDHVSYPPSIAPPWKKKRSLPAGVAVAIALVAVGGVATGIHFILQGDSGSSGGYPLAANRSNEESTVNPVVESGASKSRGQLTIEAGVAAGWGRSDDVFDDVESDRVEPIASENDAGDSLASKTPQVVKSDTPAASISSRDVVKRENGYVTYAGKVGRGNTISGRLGSYGIDAHEIDLVVDALDGLYDFRSSRPRHTYELEVQASTGDIKRFRYEAGPAEIFEVRRRGETLEGRRVPVKTTSRFIRVGRRVGSSLASAIDEAGLNRSVLRAFLSTFGSDMDFQSKQRKQDTIRVIVEETYVKEQRIGNEAVWALEYHGKAVGKLRAFYFEPPDGDGAYYDINGRSFERKRLITPCRYRRISSPFNLRRMHPILKRRAPHRGVDFAAPRGTPIVATADGETRWVGRKGANGHLVVIRHDGGLESVYAHLQKYARGLKRGQEVKQGQRIGYVGSTGRSTGPHLHFGLRLNGRFVDPLKVKSGPGRPIDGRYRGQFLRHARKLAGELSRIRIKKSS